MSPARRALASCTPRDVIARDARTPIANARLHTAAEDAIGRAENVPEAGQFMKVEPRRARAAHWAGKPLTVRIGYRAPNARLAAIVGAIAKACAPAGITVSDVTSDSTGPQTLRDGKIDVLLASTGGATGSGSTGSSAMDAYDLHTGNGNNLSGYTNGQIDGIISALAVSADPADLVRLLARERAGAVGRICRRCRCIASSGPCWRRRRCMPSAVTPADGAPAGIWTDGSWCGDERAAADSAG